MATVFLYVNVSGPIYIFKNAIIDSTNIVTLEAQLEAAKIIIVD